jgi:hypothetical protein
MEHYHHIIRSSIRRGKHRLHDGLQNVSGVLFDVQCATEQDGQGALNSTWARVSPNRSFPPLDITSRSSTSLLGAFADPPINSSTTQSINCSTSFNLSPESGVATMALYSIVNANGSGGLFGVGVDVSSSEDSTSTITCAWLAVPKQVHVKLKHWVAQSHGVEDASTFPQYVGRAVLATVQGISQANIRWYEVLTLTCPTRRWCWGL